MRKYVCRMFGSVEGAIRFLNTYRVPKDDLVSVVVKGPFVYVILYEVVQGKKDG